jgi:multiple sugar transport system substrate-binding protein
MNFLKKLFLYIAITLLSLLTVCSKPDNKRIVLAVGGAPSEVEFWEKIATQCTEQTGIELQLIRQPTDTDQRRQNLVTALRAKKSTPDIFLMDVAWIAQFAGSNWLEPLQPFMVKHNISDTSFFESVVKQADHYDNKLIALPVYVDGGLLYYRKDLLKKHGYEKPPETWDDFISCAKTITEKERQNNKNFVGYVWQGAQYEGLTCNFLEFAGSDKPGIVIDSLSPIINTKRNVEAATLMRDLIAPYNISPQNTYTDMKEEEVRIVFQNGNALFERNWPYAWKLHQSEGSAVKGLTGVALLPHFKGGRSASTLGGWHIGLSRFSKQKDKAFTCIAYLLSSEVQKQFTLQLGWNPGRPDVYNDSTVLQFMQHAAILKEVFNHTVVRPVVPYYSYMSSVIQRYLNAVLSGKIEASAAFVDCEKELQEISKRYSK